MTESDQKVDNKFDQVEDFKWLKPEQNPNWSILEPSSRVKDDLWTQAVPGKAGKGPHDILRALGINIQS